MRLSPFPCTHPMMHCAAASCQSTKYPIAELIDAVKEYMASLQDKRVPVIEYTLIKGVNDHRQHARELAKLLKTLPCKINLIPFNPFSLSD